MATTFSRELVHKVATLGRLKLSEPEVAAMSSQLGAILDYIAQLESVDTSNVEPLAHCLPITNVFRPDELVPGLTPDDALANAPKRVADFYSVPAILD